MTETTAGRMRVAQDRMVRGVGQFLDDVKLPGMGYAAFVRSPHAHAKITRIMTDDALQIPGAIAGVNARGPSCHMSTPCALESRG